MQADIIAGISVGAMVVPQGMSYAKLAGLPNVYGLYGAFVPVMIYAILGSSPQLVSSLFRDASCPCSSHCIRDLSLTGVSANDYQQLAELCNLLYRASCCTVHHAVQMQCRCCTALLKARRNCINMLACERAICFTLQL